MKEGEDDKNNKGKKKKKKKIEKLKNAGEFLFTRLQYDIAMFNLILFLLYSLISSCFLVDSLAKRSKLAREPDLQCQR